MVPLAVIVGDELGDRAAKMSLAQWNHEIKTFLFERTNRSAYALQFGARNGVRIM